MTRQVPTHHWLENKTLLYLDGIAHLFFLVLPLSSEGKGNGSGFSVVLPQGAICFYPGFHADFSIFAYCELKRRDTVPETKWRLWRVSVQREQLRLEADLKPISLPNTVFPGYVLCIMVAGAQWVTSEGTLKHTFPIQSMFVIMEKRKNLKVSQEEDG